MITQTQINFCRLARISHEEYQTYLFNQGCAFAEWFCQSLFLNKQEVKILLSLSPYWKWWENVWNIRTQYTLGFCGIDENKKKLEPTALEALREFFKENHCINEFKGNTPNAWVLNALNQKINSNENRYQKNNLPKCKAVGGKKNITKNTTIEL